MINITTAILKALYKKLSAQTVPVYSFIADSIPAPYIWIGDVEAPQAINKDIFDFSGTFSVELYYETNTDSGSLTGLLDTLQEIKYLLMPTTRSVLDITADGASMTGMRLLNETGPFYFSDDKRMMTAVLQYEFYASQVATSPENIFNLIHAADNLIFGNDNLIHIN